MNTVYHCSMSAGFGFADVLPAPPPFFDDGRSLYFAVYVRFNGTFPPKLAATVVPAHAFIAAPAAVTVSTLSAAGVAMPPGALLPSAMSMSSFAASAAASATCRILPLCVHVTAVTYLPLTGYHLNNYPLGYPLTNYYFDAPGIRLETAKFSPPPGIQATTRGYEYAGSDTAEEAFEVAADLESEDEEEDEYEDSDDTAEEAFEVAANLESEDESEAAEEDEDEDGDDTADEAFDVAADFDLRLGESTADQAAENKRAFKEKLPSPESDESEDTEEDEDSDGTVGEALQLSADLNPPLTESTQAHAAAVEVEHSSSEDGESETEQNFLKFEHFFSEEEDEAEAGAAAQADDGGVDDDDGRVLRASLVVSNSESSSLFASVRRFFRFDYYRDTFSQTNIGRRTTPIGMMASEVDYSSLGFLSDGLLASRDRAIFTLDDSDDDDDDGDGGDGVGDDGGGDGLGDGDDGGGDGDGDDEISDDSSGYDDDDINAEEFMLGVVPATEASIEALEVVTMGTRTCTICLEDYSFLMESNGHDYHEEQNGDDHHDQTVFVRMPCLHVYHKVCITQWLHRSHLCPLCRYSMPTAQD